MNATEATPFAAPLNFMELTELPAAVAEPSWLWHGYIARGLTTLLTSQWKMGKTTLLSLLLARMHRGGELAGLAVQPGRVAVVSEENEGLWASRCRRLSLGDNVCLLLRPFAALPTHEQWRGLVEQLLDLHRRRGLDLVVIDPLACFLPAHSENIANEMLAALAPLQTLTAANLAVLLLHHPRKDDSEPGQAARGSGALPGFADIVMEMSWYTAADSPDRRRRLSAFSRCDVTPRRLVIELTADGTDYVARPDDDGLADAWEHVQALLTEANGPLSRHELLRRWPTALKPHQVTLWRWLERLEDEGRVVRLGDGNRRGAFRYGLVEASRGTRNTDQVDSAESCR